MSTSVLNASFGKLDIKRHSPSILYIIYDQEMTQLRLVDALMTKNGQEDKTLFYVYISVCVVEGGGGGRVCVRGSTCT